METSIRAAFFRTVHERLLRHRRAGRSGAARRALWVPAGLAVMAGLASAPAAVRAQAPAATPAHWVEGVNYFPIRGANPPQMPGGKVEVTEVFSYACPACNLFVPTMHKLKASLPPNAVLDFLPASFNPAEDWPVFQLGYITAQVLGVADQTHDAMFNAVWQTNELAVLDPGTHRIRSKLPTIEDVAKFYQKQAGVPAEKFLATSRGFNVDMKVRVADSLLAAYQVDRTPTIVVAGKYRTHVEAAGGADQLVDLVKYLVAKEAK